jgi:N-acetylmuramoyl-L-alanine amidase
MFFVIRLRKVLIVLAILVAILGYTICKVVPTIATPVTNRVIVIDAGHGGFDPGALSDTGIEEQEINLKIALKLQRLLEESGTTTFLTRADENSVGSTKREDMKNRKEIRDVENSDMYISIHLNSFPQENVKGAQTFYSSSEESKKLAELVQAKLKEVVEPNNNRVAKQLSTVYLLKNTKKPSIIVECGFLSNSEELKKLQDDMYQEKLAWAIYLGIIDYYMN